MQCSSFAPWAPRPEAAPKNLTRGSMTYSVPPSELHGGKHKYSHSAELWLPSRSFAVPYQERSVCILFPNETVEQNSNSYCLCSYTIFSPAKFSISTLQLPL